MSVSLFLFCASVHLRHILFFHSLDSVHKWYHMLSVFLRLTALSMIISTSPVLLQMVFHSFPWQSNYPLCIYGPHLQGCPGGSDGKAPVCNAGDPGSISGLGRSPGEGNGSPLQHSCLENPMDRGAWWATVHGVARSQTRLGASTYSLTVSSATPLPMGRLLPCLGLLHIYS